MQKLQTVTRKFMQKLLFMQKIYAKITNSNYAETETVIMQKLLFMQKIYAEIMQKLQTIIMQKHKQ